MARSKSPSKKTNVSKCRGFSRSDCLQMNVNCVYNKKNGCVKRPNVMRLDLPPYAEFTPKKEPGPVLKSTDVVMPQIIEQIQRENAALKQNLEIQMNEKNILKQEINKLNNSYTALVNSTRETSSKLRDTEMKLKNINSEKLSLEKDLRELTSLIEKDKLIKVVQPNDINQLEECLKREIVYKNRINDLIETVEEYGKDNDTLYQQIQELEKQIQILEREQDIDVNYMNKYVDMIKDLRNKVKDYKKMLDSSQIEEEVFLTITTQLNAINNLTSEQRKLVNVINNLNLKINSLNKQIDYYKNLFKGTKDLASKNKKLQDEADSLYELYNDAGNKIRQLNAENAKIKRENVECKLEKSDLKTKINDLQKEKTEDKTVKQLTKENEKIKIENVKVKLEMSDLKQKVKELEKKLEICNRQLKFEDYENLTASIRKLNTELISAQTQLKQKETDYNKLVVRLNKQLDECGVQKQELQAKIPALTTEVKMLTEDLDKCMSEKQELQNQIEELRDTQSQSISTPQKPKPKQPFYMSPPPSTKKK